MATPATVTVMEPKARADNLERADNLVKARVTDPQCPVLSMTTTVGERE
jgi:hypothetical protein